MKERLAGLALGTVLVTGGCAANVEPTPQPNSALHTEANSTIVDMGKLSGPGGSDELYKSVDNTNGQVCYIVVETFTQPGPVAISCPINTK